MHVYPSPTLEPPIFKEQSCKRWKGANKFSDFIFEGVALRFKKNWPEVVVVMDRTLESKVCQVWQTNIWVLFINLDSIFTTILFSLVQKLFVVKIFTFLDWKEQDVEFCTWLHTAAKCTYRSKGEKIRGMRSDVSLFSTLHLTPLSRVQIFPKCFSLIWLCLSLMSRLRIFQRKSSVRLPVFLFSTALCLLWRHYHHPGSRLAVNTGYWTLSHTTTLSKNELDWKICK